MLSTFPDSVLGSTMVNQWPGLQLQFPFPQPPSGALIRIEPFITTAPISCSMVPFGVTFVVVFFSIFILLLLERFEIRLRRVAPEPGCLK